MKTETTATTTTILLVEDDPSIRLGLRELLSGEGFLTVECERGDQVVELVGTHHPALIVLDVMLPGRSGFDVCRDLRERGCRSLILMLTAKGQELDKVIGLDVGADDYVTKPFGVRELVARIHALLRRADVGRNENDKGFLIGDARIDTRTFSVERNGGSESLTAKELKLLCYLHTHAGTVLSRDRLLNAVWGYDYFGTTRTLDQVIAQLRRKLGEGNPPRHLLTVHGVGYRLCV